MSVSGTPIRKAAGALDVSAAQTAGQVADQVAELRAKMAALGGEVPHLVVEDADVLTIGGPLSHVLPGGGLPRRAVTQVSDTASLVVELIDQVTAAGGFVGVVGWPALSYAGIGAANSDNLERVIAVPEPGIEDIAVVGVLAEGLDLVVWRTRAPLTLTPVRARPLLARLRKGNAALVAVNVTVPSPAMALQARITDFYGIGRGTGRINGIALAVRAERKGMRPASATITLGTAPQRQQRQQRPKLTVVT